MAPYTKTTWVDEIPNSTPVKYKFHDDTGGDLALSATIEIVTPITVSGTPVNADNLNHLEVGVENAQTGADAAATAAAAAQTTANTASTNASTALTAANAAVPKSTIVAQGDILYGTGPNTVVRLPKGTGHQVLEMNGIATAPQWKTDFKTLIIPVINEAAGLTTGDGKRYFTIPEQLDGMNIVSVHACVYAVSTSGLPTVQLNNVTKGLDVLSTKVTIDANEFSSYSAATPPVVNPTADDVAVGDRMRIDVDVAGTNVLGLELHVKFAIP